jgi:hypothetical protein
MVVGAGFITVMPGLKPGTLASRRYKYHVAGAGCVEGRCVAALGALRCFRHSLRGSAAAAARIFAAISCTAAGRATISPAQERYRSRRSLELPRHLSSRRCTSSAAACWPNWGGWHCRSAPGGAVTIFVHAVVVLLARGQGVCVRQVSTSRRAAGLDRRGASCTLWLLAYDSIILCQQLGLRR